MPSWMIGVGRRNRKALAALGAENKKTQAQQQPRSCSPLATPRVLSNQ
jgi:hypothetical protein